jgi:(p)ppGpp synthase/HD superfamily hydrolase
MQAQHNQVQPSIAQTDSTSNHQRSSPKKKTTVIFSIPDRVGSLQEVLAIIANHKLNMTRIVSRPSISHDWDYDFFVDFEVDDPQAVADFADELRAKRKGEIISIQTVDDTNSWAQGVCLTLTLTHSLSLCFHIVIHFKTLSDMTA